MTFRQFAFHNVVRNKRLYAAYFLSSMFTVLVFFTFALFAYHPTFQNGGSPEAAITAMSVAGGIIYVFSFFFILYSMSSFLQSRKKEFGLFMIHGMSFNQLRKMVFLENMIIGLFSILSGISFGLVFAKLILLIAENVLIIDERLYFYIPWIAIVITFVSFTLLFFVISFFVSFVLRTRKLIELIKSDRTPKSEPKASLFLSLFAGILLIAGYAIALYVEGLQVVVALLPVVLLVTIGTYFLFTQISVYVIRRLKENKNIFWKKTNMIQFSDLSYRMKDNARSFFMVAMISTVAFSAIGGLFGMQAYLTEGIREANPFSFSHTVRDDEPKEEEHVTKIEQILEKHQIKTAKEVVHVKKISQRGRAQISVIKVSDYNKSAKLIGKPSIQLGMGEAFVSEASVANLNVSYAKDLLQKPIELENGSTVTAKKIIRSEAYQTLNDFYIVSDELFDQLQGVIGEEQEFIWQAIAANKDDLLAAGKEMDSIEGMHSIFTLDYTLYVMQKMYGPVLFIGLFIGLVFFVSAGSFLYFRLYTDLDDDKKKFETIAKIGLSDFELKKIINKQTMILFFAPLFVSLTHGAVALTALSHMLGYNLVRESVIVLASFFVIQVIYFLLIRSLYLQQIRRAIFK